MSRQRRHHTVQNVRNNALATAASLLALTSLACSEAKRPTTRPPNDVELQQQVTDLQSRLLATEKRAIVGEVESARLRRRVHDLEEQLAAAQRRGAPSGAEVAPPSSSSPSQVGSSASRGQTSSSPEPVPPRAAPEQVQEAHSAALPTSVGIQEEDLEETDPIDTGENAPPPSSAPGSGVSTLEPYATPPANAPAPPTTSRDAASSTLLPPDDATFAAYDAAYVLFHEKRYREAERQFISFVSRYPNSELTDNAQFWIGESRYARQDYQGALEAFSTTVADYPGGNKVPDAMLKAGKSLEALGRLDQARQTYLEIQRRFPETAVALAAQEQLAGLD